MSLVVVVVVAGRSSSQDGMGEEGVRCPTMASEKKVPHH
jgi:hypothetical protein